MATPDKPPAGWDPLLTYQEAMALFQVSYRTVRRLFYFRRVFKPTGGTVRIPLSDALRLRDEYMARRRKPR